MPLASVLSHDTFQTVYQDSYYDYDGSFIIWGELKSGASDEDATAKVVYVRYNIVQSDGTLLSLTVSGSYYIKVNHEWEFVWGWYTDWDTIDQWFEDNTH